MPRAGWWAAGYVCALKEPKRTLPATKGYRSYPEDSAASRREDLLLRLSQDSLTPVIRQMILSDLPLIFLPATQMNDRGRVLEQVGKRASRMEVSSRGSPVRFPQLRREGLVSNL